MGTFLDSHGPESNTVAMSLGNTHSGWLMAMLSALVMGCTVGEGNPGPSSTDTNTPPQQDVDDVGSLCPGATPLLCEATEAYEGGCWAAGMDCATIHANPGGGFVACTTDEVGTVDSTDTLACCPTSEPLYCESTEGYPGGCQQADLVCDTLFQCGDDWLLCEGDKQVACGSDGTGGCCEPGGATWCPTAGEQPGFCAGPDADCDQVLQCGDSQAVCDTGESIHCDAEGNGLCCGVETPAWCPPGSGGQPTFSGACMPAESSCATLTPGDNDTWTACKITDTVGNDVDGKVHCCGGDLPLWCPPGTGEGDLLYPGDQCLPADVDCTTLTWNANESSWTSCTTAVIAFDVDTDGNLVCCAVDTPTLCPIGTGFKDDFDGSQCLANDTDCDTLFKEGDTWTHCTVTDNEYGLTFGEGGELVLQCCSGETPQYCDVGSGDGTFDGSQCLPEGTNCSSLTHTGAKEWDWCPTGVEWGISNAGQANAKLVCCGVGKSAHKTQNNTILCCGGETPKFCPLGSGISNNFDGSTCLPADTDCASLTQSGSNDWDWCSTTTDWAVSNGGTLKCCQYTSETAQMDIDGNVICCGQAALPNLGLWGSKWCPPAKLWDGDAAYTFGVEEWNSTPACSNICTGNFDCPYVAKDPIDGSVTTVYYTCASTVDTCKQCVLPQSPVSQAPLQDTGIPTFTTTYPGSCWYDMQPDCSKLMFCGGSFKPCLVEKCYCWNGTVKPIVP
jgi:hypothetical protein